MAKKTGGTGAEALLAKLSGKGGKKKAKGLPSRTGKRKAFFVRYYTVVNPERKLRHLLRRNGHAAARAWAEQFGGTDVLRRLRGD